MSRLKLESLTIKNYRSLKNVSVEKLGRLNLITGRNNVGKTSLLEAVRLWASGTDINALLDIIDARDESVLPDQGLKGDREDDNSLLGSLFLFSGYPSIDSVESPIEISGSGNLLRVSVHDRGFEQRILEGVETEIDDLITKSKVLELTTAIPEHTVTLRLPSYYSAHRRHFMRKQLMREQREKDSLSSIPCLFLSSTTMDSIDSHNAAALWDSIALTDKEESVLQGLRLIESEILGLRFIQGSRRRDRMPVVRLANIDRPIPLHGLGDGVTRLFEIMLALVNAENGFLLVDEFENGLHYSIQKTAWETVLALSESLNVQVFATTHSNDCVSAFQQVADETDDESAMILTRLLCANGDVYAETLNREILAGRLDLGREVR